MKKIRVRATYKDKPLLGLISVGKIDQMKILEYHLQLFNQKTGSIKPSKSTFRTIDLAINHASLYGFLTHCWEITELQLPEGEVASS